MNPRRFSPIFPAISALLLFLLAPSAPADVVHLKKDENITGKVVDDGGKTIRLEIPHGALEIEKSDIEWIIYGTDKEIENLRLAAGCFERAQVFFEKQNFELAAQEFHSALEFAPDEPNLLNNLGASYARLKNYRVAIDSYDKALKANPRHATAALNLAQAYIEEQAYRKAEHILRKKAVKDPPDQLTYLLLGVVFYKNNRYTQAISNYNKALYMEESTSPRTADIYNNLGCCYARLFRLDEADYAYEKALEIRPAHYLASYNRNIVREAKEKRIAKSVETAKD